MRQVYVNIDQPDPCQKLLKKFLLMFHEAEEAWLFHI